MDLLFEENNRKITVREVAGLMMAAARTAPKGRGIDNLTIALVEEEGIREISDRMKILGSRKDAPPYLLRDAENILNAQAIVLIGTCIKSQGAKLCGQCGFQNCDEKNKFPDIPCSFNTGDLGIAIGSAVSVAMDHRIDNRVMFTVGRAVIDMKLLGEEVRIAYGIPLSISAKSPFFDRK